MTHTKWTEAMDGSPAKVKLAGVVTEYPPVDGGEPWERRGAALPQRGDWGEIIFQHGPLQEVGRNGILFEELLEFVLIPRLQGFNRETIPDPQANPADIPKQILNPFRNRETSLAITHLEESLNWLKRRTELRRRQGVEGTFQPHRS